MGSRKLLKLYCPYLNCSNSTEIRPFVLNKSLLSSSTCSSFISNDACSFFITSNTSNAQPPSSKVACANVVRLLTYKKKIVVRVDLVRIERKPSLCYCDAVVIKSVFVLVHREFFLSNLNSIISVRLLPTT